MSQELADFISARHEALRLALQVALADLDLSDAESSVTELNAKQDAFVVAAATLAAAARRLPVGRQPKGLSEVQQ
jgi:hypothetical protein